VGITLDVCDKPMPTKSNIVNIFLADSLVFWAIGKAYWGTFMITNSELYHQYLELSRVVSEYFIEKIR